MASSLRGIGYPSNFIESGWEIEENEEDNYVKKGEKEV